mgnify:CR=1 FL=1
MNIEDWIKNMKKCLYMYVMIYNNNLLKGRFLNYKGEMAQIISYDLNKNIKVILNSSGRELILPEGSYFFCDLEGKNITLSDNWPKLKTF